MCALKSIARKDVRADRDCVKSRKDKGFTIRYVTNRIRTLHPIVLSLDKMGLHKV